MTKSDRDQRLAAKLRENLRRRKMQARARSSADAPDPEESRDAEQNQTAPETSDPDDHG